jgi:hypothetical protein
MKNHLLAIAAAFTTANGGLATMAVTAARPWEAACGGAVSLGAVACALILSIRR